MSTLEVNKLAPLVDNGTITLGDSGDTFTLTAGANLTLGGSSTTITIPSGATITNNGTANGFGSDMTPSFYAYVDTNQSVSSGTNTKVQFDGELFDSDNCYDNTSNYRFTPTEAGKYFLFAQVFFGINTTGSEGSIRLYKNGTSGLQYFARSTYVGGPATQTANIQGIVDANGSSDFFEIYIDASGTFTLKDDTNQYRNWFGGYKIIGA